MLIPQFLKLGLALGIIYVGAFLFRVASDIWTGPVTRIKPQIRSVARPLSRGWFLLNIAWFVCFAVLGLCAFLKPGLALPALIGFPIAAGVIYVVRRAMLR
jgi:hypothetical protein